jgi:hypothetical protein
MNHPKENNTLIRWSLLGAAIIFGFWIISAIVILQFLPNPNDHGTFGDLFGAINALFSGWAFLGVIVAIVLQKQELTEQREELRISREAQQEQAAALEKRLELETNRSRRDLRSEYYSTLLQRFENHNWNMLGHNLNAGHPEKYDSKVSAVCFQHINMLFFAWLNLDVIQDDGSIDGWKRWVDSLVRGAQTKEFLNYGSCYRSILQSGDLYPQRFIDWMQELGLTPSVFTSNIDGTEQI